MYFSLRWGGGSGLSLWKQDFELGVGGEGQDTSRHLRVVLGPYVQYCPCETSEQTPKSGLIGNRA